ncbi:MAG: AAA family ATPase [Parasutterella sp.]
MVAGKERTNSKTLASIPKFRLKLLPLAAIYGANASGKSNLIKALGFLKTLVTTQRVKGKIPLRHFYYSEDKNTSQFQFRDFIPCQRADL